MRHHIHSESKIGNAADLRVGGGKMVLILRVCYYSSEGYSSEGQVNNRPDIEHVSLSAFSLPLLRCLAR